MPILKVLYVILHYRCLEPILIMQENIDAEFDFLQGKIEGF